MVHSFCMYTLVTCIAHYTPRLLAFYGVNFWDGLFVVGEQLYCTSHCYWHVHCIRLTHVHRHTPNIGSVWFVYSVFFLSGFFNETVCPLHLFRVNRYTVYLWQQKQQLSIFDALLICRTTYLLTFVMIEGSNILNNLYNNKHWHYLPSTYFFLVTEWEHSRTTFHNFSSITPIEGDLFIWTGNF